MIHTPRNSAAGARNAAAISHRPHRRPPGEGGTAEVDGPAGGVATATPVPYLLPEAPNAAAASFSSCAAVPSTSFGSFRKSCRSFHSPRPTVPPNAGGARSDMSKRKVLALASARAVRRAIGSLYALAFTPLLGDENP